MGHVNLIDLKCYYSLKTWLIKLLCGKIEFVNGKLEVKNEEIPVIKPKDKKKSKKVEVVEEKETENTNTGVDNIIGIIKDSSVNSLSQFDGVTKVIFLGAVKSSFFSLKFFFEFCCLPLNLLFPI